MVILLSGFQKKTQKTPKKEIDRAVRLMQEYFNEKEKEIQLEMNEIEQRLKMKRAYLESVKQQAAEDARNSAPKFGLG